MNTQQQNDEMVKDALRRAQSPVTVTLPQRWMLNVTIDALNHEIARVAGQLKRKNIGTSTRYVTTKRLELLRETVAAVEEQREAAV